MALTARRIYLFIWAKMPFYAVRECSPFGAAIFTKWPDCDKFVKGRKTDGFKKFDTIELALDFIKVKMAIPFKTEPKSTVKLVLFLISKV